MQQPSLTQPCSSPTRPPSGAITRLSTRALHAELVRFGCDVTGDIAVRRARLKRTVRNLKAMALDDVDDATSAKDPDVKALRGIRRDLAAADVAPRYICVVDFECTCEENATDFPHEIIEFPVVGILNLIARLQTHCNLSITPLHSHGASSCLFFGHVLPNHDVTDGALDTLYSTMCVYVCLVTELLLPFSFFPLESTLRL